MKVAISLLPLDFSQGNIVQVRLRGPAKVIGSCIVAEQPRIALTGRSAARHNAKIALVVEFDPTAPEIEKRFVGVMQNLMVDSSEVALQCAELVHVATQFIPPNGEPLAIYEAPVLEAAKNAAPIEVVSS